MNQIKKIWDKYYDYLIIALIYGLLHIMMHTDYWDDVNMSTVLASFDYKLFDYLSHIWNNWGSTVFLLGTESVIEALPNYIWKILDVVMIEIVYHYLFHTIKLLTGHTAVPFDFVKRWFILFFFCVPYSMFASAGWMTTTIAYVWTFAAFFYSIYIFLSVSQNNTVKWPTYIIFGLAVIYCSNCNLVSFAVFVMLVYVFLTCKNKGKTLGILFVEGMFGSILNMVMFIVCPGNLSRNLRDAEFHNTGDVLNLSFFGHIRMGINSVFYHFTSVPNVILFTACLVLAVCTFYKTRQLLIRIVSLVPLALEIVWTVYLFFTYTVANRTLTYVYPDALFRVCPEVEQYMVLASAFIMVLCMCFLLAYLTDFTALSWFLIGCLVSLGLLPNVALGFTTTVSASVMRTAMFFYFSLVLCTGVLVTASGVLKNKLWRNAFYVFGGLGAVLNIMQVIRHIIVYG